MLRLYGAYKEEGNLAVDVSFLIDPEVFVVDDAWNIKHCDEINVCKTI